MDIYMGQIKNVITQLDDLRCLCEKEMHDMPQGNLVMQTIRDKHYYYQATSPSGNYKRKGVTGNKDLVGQLARKEYLARTNEAAIADIKLLEQLLAKYKSLDPAEVIKRMSKAAQTVPPELFLGQGFAGAGGQQQDDALKMRLKEYHQWAQEDFSQSTYRPQEKIHLTSSGIYVRSLSEAIIAERLTANNVPFRYEQLIKIDGKWFSPDFTIRVANARLLYWEHAGMMDDQNYVSRHLSKISYYQRAGIVPWKNLIVTYGTSENGLDMEEIDFIIRHIIMKQL